MEDHINEQEALKLIRGTIADTKDSVKEKGWIYVILGSIFLFAAIANFIFLKVKLEDTTEIMWVAIFLNGFASLIYSWLRYRSLRLSATEMNPKISLRTPLESMWVGYGWVMLATLLSSANNTKEVYPILIVVIAMVALISSGTLLSKPFKIGSSVTLFIGMLSFQASLENKLLLIGAAGLCAFIIPGILLVRKSNLQ